MHEVTVYIIYTHVLYIQYACMKLQYILYIHMYYTICMHVVTVCIIYTPICMHEVTVYIIIYTHVLYNMHADYY